MDSGGRRSGAKAYSRCRGAKATSKAISSIIDASPAIVKAWYKYLSCKADSRKALRLTRTGTSEHKSSCKGRISGFSAKGLAPAVLQVVDGIAVDVLDQVHGHHLLEEIPLVASEDLWSFEVLGARSPRSSSDRPRYWLPRTAWSLS